MKIVAVSAWIRVLALTMAIPLLACALTGGTRAAGQEIAADQAQKAAAAKAELAKQAQAQAEAETAKNQILADCKYSKTETNPKKMTKALDCVQRRVAALKRQILVEKSLQATVNRVYGVPAAAAPAGPAPRGVQPPGRPTEGQSYAGQSASNTPSTCGKGTGANNPLIRVHRMLMAPKNASDDFGRRLGRRFIIYQVTISNDNKDFQFLIHDVTVDLSMYFGVTTDADRYLYSASSQELTLLRGIPEKGQDLDPRNLTLHVLQGIGSVAAGVSGLTSFADTMGPSAAVFNGPFLQSFIAIAPDHTGTQLNRLSDSAYIVNTLIDKQRAKTIAIFIPEATILSKAQQNDYWKDPYRFLQSFNLDQADVCVDGAFITTIAPPTLTSAVLTPKTPGSKLGQGVDATLTVSGTNLTAGDTQVVGLGPTLTLTNANGTSGTVDLTLPANYTAGMTIHLASAANPSVSSATIPTVAQPTLTKAVLIPKTTGTALAAGVQVTVQLEGTNLTAGDTQIVVGPGPPVTLTSATGTTGSVDLQLPSGYTAGMTAYVVSAANPDLQSAAIATTSAP